jgi:hypothetical protein
LSSAAPAAGIARWRALRPALGHRIDVVRRRARATGAATLGFGIAAWQELRPTLERRIGEALRRTHVLAAAARRLGSAAWRSLATAIDRRIDQAKRRIHAIGVTTRARGGAAWQGLMLALASRVDQAKRHIHAFGVTARALAIAAWQAPSSRFVMAGVAVVAVAIAAWCLMQPHRTIPPQIAGTSAVPMPGEIAGAPTIDTPAVEPPVGPPAPAQPPSMAEAPPAPEEAKPEEAVGFLAPVLKPPPPLPTLMAYLKPARKTAAPARQEEPEPKLQEGGPLPPLPGTSPATPDELRRRDDPRGFDIMLDQMFSDGAGRKAPQAGALSRTLSSWLRLWPIWNDRIVGADDPGDPVDPARDVGETR